MNFFKKIGLILTFAIAFFFGCQKEQEKVAVEDLIPSTILMEGVSVENGMVVFDTKAAFDKTVEFLANSEKNEKNIDFDALFPNFVSSLEAFDALTEEDIMAEGGSMTKFQDYAIIIEGEDGDSYLEPVIDSKIFGQIANAEGFYRVGDKVIKTTYGFDFEIEASDYYDGISLKQINSIAKKYEIVRNETLEKYTTWGYCSKVYYWKRGKQNKKMVGRFITRWASLGRYTEARVRTTNYVRASFGTWKRDKAYMIHQDGSGNYQLSVPNIINGNHIWLNPVYFSFNHTVMNKKELDQLIVSNQRNSSVRYVLGMNSGTHMVKKHNDNYGPATCHISF